MKREWYSSFSRQKEGSDYKEIDLLGRQIERLARVSRYMNSGNEADLNPNVANRNKGERKSRQRTISARKRLRSWRRFYDESFEYQLGWHKAGLEHRIRDILKSRQIGATFYFSRESLLHALKTGHNQIFLSASKTQAYVFREYIIQFARRVDVELTGDPIVLGNNGAKLIFSAPTPTLRKAITATCWSMRFSGSPTSRNCAKSPPAWPHKTPPVDLFFHPVNAGAWRVSFLVRRAVQQGPQNASEHVEIDISHSALAAGKLCDDGQWRQIVTIEDALRGGCNLFDLDVLKRENSAEDFRNLFMCEFVDDSASVFPFEELQGCMVDSLVEWTDVNPYAGRPFGDRPVWVGYDPAHSGDSAGCVVLAPPMVTGGKFRILERHQWKGMDFATQAESIRRLTEKYNVEYIGIDATGIGQGVFQLVRAFYPAAREIRYSAEVKTAMVLKAKDTIGSGRLEYDTAYTDITKSFMAIRKTMTASGRGMTYEASRSEEASHADVAWATMHALLNEPLTAANGQPSKSILDFNR